MAEVEELLPQLKAGIESDETTFGIFAVFLALVCHGCMGCGSVSGVDDVSTMAL
jgi:hypothetical protein